MPKSDSPAIEPAKTMYDQGGPYVVSVDDGENLTICQCGRSENPPFCTGRHTLEHDAGLPLKFTAKSIGKIAVCGCGNSHDMPWCDARHGLGSCSTKKST
ncbi:MAG: CDGSH iron-sulfur domain-containing protein [Magnetococcales bacterium]|nr:CDGSH iron-sulfur domain-containing protein [Magnetococcales bacterium]